MKNIILALLAILTILNIYNYQKTKKELKKEYQYTKDILNIANKIITLKKEPLIPTFCNKKANIIKCTNLNKTKLEYVNLFIQKAYIKTLLIQKNKNIDVTLELK
jgi:type II secretory pathway pseudopilin PulG